MALDPNQADIVTRLGRGNSWCDCPNPGESKGQAVRAVLSTQPRRARRLRIPCCPAPLRGAWLRVRGGPDHNLSRDRYGARAAPNARPRRPPARRSPSWGPGSRPGAPAASPQLGAPTPPPSLSLARPPRRNWARVGSSGRNSALRAAPAETEARMVPSGPPLKGVCGDRLRTRPRSRPRPQHRRDPPCTSSRTRLLARFARSHEAGHAPKALCPRKGAEIWEPNLALSSHAPSSQSRHEPHPRLP